MRPAVAAAAAAHGSDTGAVHLSAAFARDSDGNGACAASTAVLACCLCCREPVSFTSMAGVWWTPFGWWWAVVSLTIWYHKLHLLLLSRRGYTAKLGA